MKTKTLLAMGLGAAIWLSRDQAALSQEQKEHKEGHEKRKVETPESGKGILKKISEHQRDLAEVVKEKKLANVHHHTLAIRNLAKALPAKTPAEKSIRIERTVKAISRVAEDVDASADAKDQAKTEANLKQLDFMLKMLRMQLLMRIDEKGGRKD